MDQRFLFLCASLAPVAVAVSADYLTVDAAQKAIYPDADAFQEIVLQQSPAQLQAILARAGPQPPHGTIRIWRAVRNGVLLGHVFVDEVVGRQSLITYALGIDASGSIGNLEIMAYRESHGGEVRNPAWRAQFANRSVRKAYVALVAPTSKTSPARRCRRNMSPKESAGCWRCGRPCCDHLPMTRHSADACPSCSES